jgi:hypothetical protein
MEIIDLNDDRDLFFDIMKKTKSGFTIENIDKSNLEQICDKSINGVVFDKKEQNKIMEGVVGTIYFSKNGAASDDYGFLCRSLEDDEQIYSLDGSFYFDGTKTFYDMEDIEDLFCNYDPGLEVLEVLNDLIDDFSNDDYAHISFDINESHTWSTNVVFNSIYFTINDNDNENSFKIRIGDHDNGRHDNEVDININEFLEEDFLKEEFREKIKSIIENFV